MALAKIISQEDLFRGEAFRRGSSTYPTTREITESYFENTEAVVDEYRIKVWQSNDVIVEKQSEEEIDILNERPVYTKVHIDGILKPQYQIDMEGDVHNNVISMLYAVDVQNPIAKVYTGYERMACLNLSVFNPRHIVDRKFSDVDFNHIYRVIPEFIEKTEEYRNEYMNAFELLHNTRYVGNQLFDCIGRLAFRISKQPGMVTAFNNAVKFLQSNQEVNDIKNIYFNRDWQTTGYSAFDIYQTLTATLSNKGLKEPDKIYQAYKLII